MQTSKKATLRALTQTALAAMGLAIIALPGAAQAATVVDTTVGGVNDLYNLNLGGFDGSNAIAVNVAGLSSVTFSVSGQVMLNIGSGDTWNDADGIGAAPATSSNTGGNGISGMTAPYAGYLSGVFVGSTIGSTPTALDFTGAGGTSFSSLSPVLQQSFYIGDGLTGDTTGATQTFLVPTGATTLYLGISDACGYNGGPSCYGDNQGTFKVAVTELTAAVPEPSTWALSILGIGLVGAMVRRRPAGADAGAVPA